MRDAANLSWKLDRVLRGESDIRLLDTYTTERGTHLEHAIAMSVELGRVICVLDEGKAAERDTRMIAGGADPAKVLPITALPVLGEGVTARAGDVAALHGTLAPQFPVQANGRQDLLDEVTGFGAVLLVRGDRPTGHVDATVQELLDDTDVRLTTLGENGTPDLRDVTGRWSRWFDAHAVSAVLIRPDHYVFGAVTNPAGLSELLSDYRDRLRVLISSTATRTAATTV
jgi:hypothetical protein